MARQVDALYLFELGIAGFFTALICALIVGMAVRYRRSSNADRSHPPLKNRWLEVRLDRDPAASCAC